MIKGAHRFHGRNSLRFVFQRGKSVRGAQVSLRYVLNNRRKEYRAAVVVSRKVSKSAVVRNRVRRRIYEIIRKNSSRITRPYDLVFTVYSEEAAEMPHAQLQKIILGKLEKAQVLGAAPEAEHDIVDKNERNN